MQVTPWALRVYSKLKSVALARGGAEPALLTLRRSQLWPSKNIKGAYYHVCF